MTDKSMRTVSVVFTRNIDLDSVKDNIFSAIEEYVSDAYDINDPPNDIENYDAFVLDALCHAIKHFYPDNTTVIVDYK